MKERGSIPIIIAVLAVLGIAGYFIYENQTKINLPEKSPIFCKVDSDCVLGIQLQKCCGCPAAVSKDSIGKNDWATYEPGKDYSKTSRCQTFIACKPCQLPVKPVCQNNKCLLPTSRYVCPESGYVDCMPAVDMNKQKSSCAAEAIAWFKTNCPDFKGIAY